MDILKHLEKYGYAVQENVISSKECSKMSKALDSLKIKKEKNGSLLSTSSQTVIKNVHLEQPEVFLKKISLPKVMDTVSKVLQDEFILSNFNASLSGKTGGSRVHIDSRVPINDFKSTLQIVATLCIDDFTIKNGSTIVWPYTHTSGKDPKHVKTKSPYRGLQVNVPKGSIIYVLGQTWHDVGPNLNDQKRWGIIAYYSRWWIKPTFDFTKCGKKIFNKLNKKQKQLMGFTSIPPTNKENRTKTLIPVNKIPKNYDAI
ncbi:MAG: hypothetical protein CL763_09685 [Chloroflexi bacterium]|nr:hypothetical protein [Chloroflexota bacterium]MBL77176.1 hypothetical protein [Chloroflexota bacterium]|tara:strand:+ start:12482 stop:13255 length:774 start_codon:yes stop_codon:yes gene_type:complete